MAKRTAEHVMAGSPGLPRVVTLPRDRKLTVRPVTPNDVDGLQSLYGVLSIDDLHRRFFSVYRPSRELLDKWAHLDDTSGFGLVAVISNGTEQIVGHATYGLMPDGAGDFGIVVAADWRCWLGSYLLDALVEAAAERGVPDLQADILLENRPMLALVRSRGYVKLGRPDWSILRVMISTTEPLPETVGSSGSVRTVGPAESRRQ